MYHAAFWLLLVYGWGWDELGPRAIGVFLLLLWTGGMFGLDLCQTPSIESDASSASSDRTSDGFVRW